MSKKNKKKSAVKIVDEKQFELNQDQANLENLNSAQIETPNEEPVEDTTPANNLAEETSTEIPNEEKIVEEEAKAEDLSFVDEKPIDDSPILEESTINEEETKKEESLVEEEKIDEVVEDTPSSLVEEVPPTSVLDNLPLNDDAAKVDNLANLEETTTLDPATQTPAEPPVEEIHEHTPPQKKTLSKKQKKIILISTLSAVLVIALVLGISLPIYFHFKDKIMINSAEDFQNVSKGTYYVLNKDITVEGDLDLSQLGNYSIDLNKHVLTVKGNLIYKGDAAGVISIGNTKKRNFIDGGTLMIEGKLMVSMPNANLDLLSITQTNGAEISAKNVSINTLTSNVDVTITAEQAKLKGKIATNANASVTVNGGNIEVAGSIESTLRSSATLLNVKSNLEITKIELADTASAQIAGKITTSINGGLKVAMLAGHSCGEYNNIINLALYRADATNYTMKGCQNIFYIDKFEAPADFIIEERPNGKIFAVASAVPNASNYIFTIDDKVIESTSPELDISKEMVEGGPKKHVISVKAKGNFDFNTFETLGDVQYVDGDTVVADFTYKITLEIPSNVTAQQNPDGRILLSFSTVNFATGYEITINGVSFNVENQNTGLEVVDITDKLPEVGTYAIRVKAFSSVAEINPSPQALTSFTKMAKLEGVAGLNATLDQADNILKINYEIPANAKSFIIYAQNAAGEKVELGRTSLNEFSIDGSTLAEGYNKIVVVAEGHSFFESSAEVSIDIVKA